MSNLKFETIEIEALIQIINSCTIRGSDAHLIVKLLNKLEESKAIK